MSRERVKHYYTYQLDMKVLNGLSIILLMIVSGVVLLLEYQEEYIPILSPAILLIIMFLWLILHELLHGIGFALFKSVDKKNITFGMFLEKGIFYCMCKQQITKKVILTSLLFPITWIGLVTLIVGMHFNQYELVLLSIANIASSIGDIVMTIYFLKSPKDIIYLDLDDCTSFTVLSSSSLEKQKIPGIKLAKNGIFVADKMNPKKTKKITISKLSYLLIIIISLILIIDIIKRLIL